MENKRVPIYLTTENEAQLMEMYHKKLAGWPVPYESIFIPTRFGETHVLRSGPLDAPPVVLLHAMGLNAEMWLPNIEALSQKFRVHAIDTIGDLGKSRLTDLEVFPRKGQDYADWLNDLFTKLEIKKACLIGASMGGWITMNFAYHFPKQVNKLILLGPMGIPSATLRVFKKLWSVLLFPTRKNKEKMIAWAIGDNAEVKEAYGEYMRVALNCRGKMGFPIKLKDRQLSSIYAPTLLLLGDKDEPIGPPQAVKKRVEKLMPDVKVEILAGAGHLMNIEYSELVNSKIVEFLGQL